MTFEISITESKVETFSNQAKVELKTQIADISNKLVDEALRVETSGRLRGNVQEVTSSIVKKASELFLLRYDYINRRPNRLWLEIISNISMALMGIFFTVAFSGPQTNKVLLLIGIIFLAVGIVAMVLSIMNKI